MDHAVRLTQQQKRFNDTLKNRSDALNRIILARDEQIASLQAELMATRICTVIGFLIMFGTLLKVMLGGVRWRSMPAPGRLSAARICPPSNANVWLSKNWWHASHNPKLNVSR